MEIKMKNIILNAIFTPSYSWPCYYCLSNSKRHLIP